MHFSSLPKNSPAFPCIDNWVFDYFILADKLFAKALRSFKTCVLVNNNLCRKLCPSLALTIIFDERFKVTLVPYFLFLILGYQVVI